MNIIPEVSVIVPNYNHSKYLIERIQSILNQSYQNFELIILDDLSVDDSRLIIEGFRRHDKVSAIVYNELNSGSTFIQWKKGIDLSKGKYIWIAESDDVASPDFLKNMLSCFEKDGAIGVGFCQSYRIDLDSKLTGSWLDHTNEINGFDWTKDFITDGKEFLAEAMMFQNSIPNASAVMFKKELLDQYSIDSTMTLNGDWLFYSKLLVKCKICYISQPLNYFRYHQNKGSIRNVENFNNIKEYYKVLKFLFSSISMNYKQKKVVTKYAFFKWLIQCNGNVFVMFRNNFKSIYNSAKQVDPKIKTRILKSLIAKPFKVLFR